MKNLFIALTDLLLSISVFASDNNDLYSTEIDQSVEAISVEDLLELKEDKAANCFAYTSCRDGRVLRCQTYGYSCTFRAQQGRFVECTGFNVRGQWVKLFARCY